ncbi:MAG: type II toxin-antitoxin system VapC family toxin [Pseudomonadota bacterium]
MRLLIDTHILIWFAAGSDRLPAAMRDAMIDERSVPHVSAVTVWEISIKRALGKLDVPASLVVRARDFGFLPLPVTWAHAEEAGSLPMHHSDPFDRMLIAQARLEDLVVMTLDRQFRHYDLALF